MDVWHWLLGHSDDLIMWLGPVVFPMAILIMVLPSLIAQTPHARSQRPPIPAFPLMPGQHFRLLAYAFGQDAWRNGSFYQQGLLLLFRAATLVGYGAIALLFVVTVAAQIQAAEAYPPR